MAEMQYKTRNVSSNVLTEITPTSTLSDLSAPHQPIVPYFFVSLPLNHPKKTMHIRLVKSDKKRFLDLLLLADEQESMIDRYIERGDLFVMEEKGEAKAVAVVTREGQGIYELKNLAVAPACQRKGYGRMMVEHVWHYYADCRTLSPVPTNRPKVVRSHLPYQGSMQINGAPLPAGDHSPNNGASKLTVR